MKRALLAVAALAPMVAAAYACSTDTFTDADAASEGGGGGVTQADFCDAEAQYFRNCSQFDAACIQQDLQNCGALYNDFTSGFATAVAHCMTKGGFTCNTEIGKAILSLCMKEELAGYQNDSGMLATFTQDFCAKCDPGSPT